MTSIFQTYDRYTGARSMEPPKGFINVPVPYNDNLLYKVEKIPLIEESTVYHPSKHPMIQTEHGYIGNQLSSNGRPNDIYIESAPEFVKNFNVVLPSNYILDSENNTYMDGTRLGGIDWSKAYGEGNTVIGIHMQEKSPLPVNEDNAMIAPPALEIITEHIPHSSELVEKFEKMSTFSGKIPITLRQAGDYVFEDEEKMFEEREQLISKMKEIVKRTGIESDFNTPIDEVKKENETSKDSIKNLTVRELKSIAKERGFKGYSKKNKAELQRMLS